MAGDNVVDETMNQAPQAEEKRTIHAAPTFSGETTNDRATASVKATKFMQDYETWATTSKLKDEEKVMQFPPSLMGQASLWWGNLGRCSWNHTYNLESWDDIKAEFLKEFTEEISTDYISKEIEKLRQKKDEHFKDFYRRAKTLFTMDMTVWGGYFPKNRENNEALRRVQDRLFTSLLKQKMKPELLNKLAQTPNVETSDDIYKAALKIEDAELKARLSQRKTAVNAVSIDEDDQRGAPMAAMQTKPKKKAKKPGPGYVCRICQKEGHWIQDCPDSDKQARKGARPKFNKRSNDIAAMEARLEAKMAELAKSQQETNMTRAPPPPPVHTSNTAAVNGYHYPQGYSMQPFHQSSPQSAEAGPSSHQDWE